VPLAMKRQWANSALLALLAPIAGHGESSSAAKSPVVACADLTGLKLPDTQIMSATRVAGPPVSHCNVIGVIGKRVSEQDPDHFTYGIGFELNLPDQWTGRFEMQGGSGSDGSVSSPLGTAGVELSEGWAVAADDGGHEDRLPNPFGWTDDDPSAGGAQHFGIDEQARLDYGYKGIEKTATISNLIIAHYYGERASYSYLCGCSNGGRDGIVAAERAGNLFDGIVAGNPGLELPRAGIASAWNAQALAPLATRTDVNGQPYLPDTFPPQDLEVVASVVLSACDALDGLVDGIIDNFPACTDKRVLPVLNQFTCSKTGAHGNTPHAGTCLTAAQVGALKRIMGGPKNSKGEPLYARWFWDAGLWDPATAFGAGFWLWNVGEPGAEPLVNNSINLTLGAGAVPMIFSTPPVVTPVSGPQGQEAFMFKYNFDTDAPKIYESAPFYELSAMDFMGGALHDLTPYRRQGGKLIIYSSVNDGIFSGAHIVNWYEQMNRAKGGHAHEFARLFMVPNMAHCGGGPATNSFAGSMLQAIKDWVESGRPPDRIVAANINSSSPFPSGGLFDKRVAKNFPTGGTRPLCPYPQQSRYQGSGSTADAAHFACLTPDPSTRANPDIQRHLDRH
jgi:hypothetical protein